MKLIAVVALVFVVAGCVGPTAPRYTLEELRACNRYLQVNAERFVWVAGTPDTCRQLNPAPTWQ